MSLTSPLVPPETDLRDFPFMPVDIVRLFGSEFHTTATDSEWRAGVTLWLKSFHQVPAASLPADDASLARLAELGRDIKTWKKVKTGALRGWTLCDDGRYYHKVVAEKALEAWLEKVTQRKVSAAGNAKRYNLKFDPAPFDAEIEKARLLLSAINPQSRLLRKRPPSATPNTSHDPPDGRPDGNPDPLQSGSQETGTRTRTGTGIEEKESAAQPLSPAPPRIEDQSAPPDKPLPTSHPKPDVDLRVKLCRLYEAAGLQAPDTALASVWLAQGYSADLILAVVRSKLKPGAGKPLAWFSAAIAEACAVKAPAPPEPKPVSEDSWRNLLFAYRKTGRWAEVLGPPPGSPGCRVPSHLLEEAA
jgi:hypothetical protein